MVALAALTPVMMSDLEATALQVARAGDGLCGLEIRLLEQGDVREPRLVKAGNVSCVECRSDGLEMSELLSLFH